MSLEFAHGDVLWATADGIGTTYVISGLSFQPKFLMFVINGQSSGTDAVSTISARIGVGFATSITNRRCQGFLSVNAAASADCQECYRSDQVIITVSAAAAVDGLLDLQAIASDGFTLIVDDAAPVDLRVFWYAWGGSDITNVAIGEITEPAAIGNQSYTVTGNFEPTVAFFVGCQLTAAPPVAAAIDAGFMFGAATGTGAGNQFVCCSNEDEGSANMDTDHYMRGDECLAMIAVAGGNPNARATFNGFDSVGFDLNWLARGVTNRRYIYAAIQGGSWKVGNYTIDVGTLGNTATVSGLSFQPKGAVHAQDNGAEEAVGTSQINAFLMLGAWSSLTSRRVMAYRSIDGAGAADIQLTIDYDSVMISGTTWAVDIDVINTDGFRMIVDVAGGGAGNNQFQAFIAFADTPLMVPYQPWMHRGPVLAQ